MNWHAKLSGDAEAYNKNSFALRGLSASLLCYELFSVVGDLVYPISLLRKDGLGVYQR